MLRAQSSITFIELSPFYIVRAGADVPRAQVPPAGGGALPLHHPLQGAGLRQPAHRLPPRNLRTSSIRLARPQHRSHRLRRARPQKRVWTAGRPPDSGLRPHPPGLQIPRLLPHRRQHHPRRAVSAARRPGLSPPPPPAPPRLLLRDARGPEIAAGERGGRRGRGGRGGAGVGEGEAAEEHDPGDAGGGGAVAQDLGGLELQAEHPGGGGRDGHQQAKPAVLYPQREDGREVPVRLPRKPRPQDQRAHGLRPRQNPAEEERGGRAHQQAQNLLQMITFASIVEWAGLIILPLFLRKMLKKGDAHLNIAKKTKQYTEPSQSFSDFNKENLCSRSLLDPLNDSHSTDHPPKQKGREAMGNGSTLISPTFQSIPQLSLKDHLYKQDGSYINVNFSLKDVAKKGTDEEKYSKALEEVEELKQQLLDHYKSKKYWNKISDLFEKEGVDAVLAWQKTIEQYKQLKASKEEISKQKQALEGDLIAKDERIASQNERIAALEKQIMQDKNETRVLSQKKCKGCEGLEQKQKQYQQLYGQNKRTLKQLEQLRQVSQEAKEQHRKLEEKYTNLVQVKEELEKKNAKLFEREKELAGQLVKLEKAFKEDVGSSKELHIEIEKLKEEKYQVEKSISKNEEKHRREVAELRTELAGVEEERNILASQSEKVKAELNQAKSRLFKKQFQQDSLDETLKIKMIECDDLKRRHIDSMGEELRIRNGLEDQLKNTKEELRKAYHLIDEAENVKVSLEMELNQERKATVDREEELAKQIDLSKDLEDRFRENEDRLRDYEERLREFEENQHRIREASQSFVPARNKGLNMTNFQGNAQSCSPQANSLLVRICCKIREFYSSLGGQEHPDSFQKRKGREEASEEREQVNLLRTERYVNEIYTQFSNLRNKYEFVCKENDTLKMQIENEASYKQQEAEQLQREIDLKQEALRAISSCIPEQLREPVLEFLCLTEQLAAHDHHDNAEFEEYEELKENLEGQAKEWKDHYQKLDRRLKKLEEEARRLDDQNEQLKRKMKIADPKRQLQTEYDYKKDIRKKYNI